MLGKKRKEAHPHVLQPRSSQLSFSSLSLSALQELVQHHLPGCKTVLALPLSKLDFLTALSEWDNQVSCPT